MGSLCSISNNFFQDENYMTIKGPSKTSTDVNNNQYLFSSISKRGKRKYLTDFTPLDFCDEISKIFKIRIPFFDNSPLQAISNLSYLTGNGPYHEGLIFQSKTYNFYIAQSYPITFVKVNNFSQGITDIISFNNFNNTSHSYKIPEVYFPTLPITIIDIYEIINKLPNQYHILTDNCQNFVNKIIEGLRDKYHITNEKDPVKIEESLNDLKNANLNKKKKKQRTKDLNNNSISNNSSKSNQLVQTYVDENSIYLFNIFEKKKNYNKLKSSRSDENILGRMSKNLNRKMHMNYTSRSNNYFTSINHSKNYEN